MLVVEVDGVEPEPPQAGLAGGAHVLRAAADAALRRVVGITDDAELGGDGDAVPPAL